MRFPSVTSAALNAMEANRPPAIIQQARNCAWHRQRITSLARAIEHDATEYRTAVKEFKESGTWRDEFKTWDDCSRTALGITPQTANRLIRELTEHTIDTSEPPRSDPDTCQAKNEHKSKEEPKPGEKQDDKPTTQTDAEKQPNKTKSKATTPAKQLDDSGAVVPAHLLGLMERKGEVTEAMYWASKLHSLFDEQQTSHDPLYRNLQTTGNVQTFMSSAASMHSHLRDCLPEIVCPVCQGSGKGKHRHNGTGKDVEWCYYCSGSGMISRVCWNRDWEKSNDKLKKAEVVKRASNQ